MEQMELSEDSGLALFDNNPRSSACELTPIFKACSSTATNTPLFQMQTVTNYTPTTSFLNSSRKRKISHIIATDAENVANLDVTYSMPQFSSTMNESLLDNLQSFNITNKFESCELTPGHYDDFKPDMCSVPTTPIKQIKSEEKSTLKSQNANLVGSSPYKEAQKILYPNLKPIVPFKRVTPQKFNNVTKDGFSPAKKRLFDNIVTRLDPVKYFRGTYVMSRIFSLLSDLDLYRISKVSTGWYRAVTGDPKTNIRYKSFVEKCMKNKENYRNTPPSSPPSPDSPPVSPNSKVFHSYTKLAKKLLPGQSLQKCPICDRPSVVEKNISQCQNANCNYIHCLLCLSFSTTGPEDFYNKCQLSQLVVEKNRSNRFCLADLSNSAADITSYLSDSSFRCDSGFYSEPERTSTPTVRRNLSSSFRRSSGVLSEHNYNSPPKSKKMQSVPLVSVVGCNMRQHEEIAEPSSPPKVKNVAFSKQSKKNLKRLLR